MTREDLVVYDRDADHGPRAVLWGAEIKNNPPTVEWSDFKEDMNDYTRLGEAEKAKLTQVLKNIVSRSELINLDALSPFLPTSSSSPLLLPLSRYILPTPTYNDLNIHLPTSS